MTKVTAPNPTEKPGANPSVQSDWLRDREAIKPASNLSDSAIQKRIDQLTMPPGALQRLLQPYARLVAHAEAWQLKTPLRIASLLFAADHSLAVRQPISAFPQVVTRQMVRNFLSGGACQSVLARKRCCSLTVVDIGVARASSETWLDSNDGPAKRADDGPMRTYFVDGNIPAFLGAGQKFANGCLDPSAEDSLGSDAAKAAFERGFEVAAAVIKRDKPHALVLGEMGIGNTTASTAVAEILLGSKNSLAGRGTGVGDEGLAAKVTAIKAIRGRFDKKEYSQTTERACAIYTTVAGFEHAALAGAAYAAAMRGVFIILDGLIVTAAIAPLIDCYENLPSWIIAGHVGSEPAHRQLLEKYRLEPLLDLGLRLGEGSGALLAAGLLMDAHSIATEMSTFESAGIATS
jgi:nicotinate-nucleotide--dimethylbenzimidazole phosphoribosyltransferase